MTVIFVIAADGLLVVTLPVASVASLFAGAVSMPAGTAAIAAASVPWFVAVAMSAGGVIVCAVPGLLKPF